jgi:hypothetical protein
VITKRRLATAAPRRPDRLCSIRVVGLALAAALSAQVVAAQSEFPAAHDTTIVRLEAGARSDWTNELFYEESFTDTTFLPPQRVTTPESRYAAVMTTYFEGLRDGRTRYRVQSELNLGNRLQRIVAGGSALAMRGAWDLAFAPWAEFERDQTFGRDLRRGLANAQLRLRRGGAWDEQRFEVGTGAELGRSSGLGSEYLLDRNVLRGWAGFEHAPLFGTEARIGYDFNARRFPDSLTRNHDEHAFSLHARRELGLGHSLAVDGNAVRRVGDQPVPDSRDRFSQADARADWEWRGFGRIGILTSGQAEAMRYDDPDSVAFFDYQLYRARIAPRYEYERMRVSFGPRAEILEAPWNPSESYRELAATVDLDMLAGGAWWSLSPAIGWREYDEVEASLHSPYRFYDLSLYGDHPLGTDLRLRVLATGRIEEHARSADDARSLYLSVDVRRLF